MIVYVFFLFLLKLFSVIGVNNIFFNIICSFLILFYVVLEKLYFDVMELLIKGGVKVRGICFDLFIIFYLVLERFYFLKKFVIRENFVI